jgi:hypothetical protein
MSKFTKKDNSLTNSYICKLSSNKSAHFYDFHYVTWYVINTMIYFSKKEDISDIKSFQYI